MTAYRGLIVAWKAQKLEASPQLFRRIGTRHARTNFQAASASHHNQPRPRMILKSGQPGLRGGHIDGRTRDRACDEVTEVLRRIAGLVETDEYIEAPDGATHPSRRRARRPPSADIGVSFL